MKKYNFLQCKKTKNFLLFFLFFFFILSFFTPDFVIAETGTPEENNTGVPETTPKQPKKTDVKTFEANVVNPLNSGSTEPLSSSTIIGRGIKLIFGLVGALALLMFVIGGMYWILSFGNEKRVTAGRDTMVWAIIGLVLAFTSYAMVNFVLWALTNMGSS